MGPQIKELVAACVLLVVAGVQLVNCEAVIKMVCKDTISNCKEYSNDICATFPAWAKENCERRCGFCKQTCPDNWTYYKDDNTCYHVFGIPDKTERETWKSARLKCKTFGGDLAIIRDEKKNKELSEPAKKTGTYVWIGIHNVAKTGYDFEYVDGTKLGSYRPWLKENPNNREGLQYCVNLYPDPVFYHNFMWNDYKCTIILSFICSVPAN